MKTSASIRQLQQQLINIGRQAFAYMDDTPWARAPLEEIETRLERSRRHLESLDPAIDTHSFVSVNATVRILHAALERRRESVAILNGLSHSIEAQQAIPLHFAAQAIAHYKSQSAEPMDE